MISISDRLIAITEMVAAGGVAADIGCDHCLTLMYLIENGVIRRGIGSDVKQGPLEKARQNIERHGFQNKIELRLGNGLDKIKPDEADIIIVSGMGGHLLIDILEAGAETAQTAKQLVLQPQNDVRAVRESLFRLGYNIIAENMVIDEGKYYNIIKAEYNPCVECYENERDYAFGKELIDRKSPVLTWYLTEKLEKNVRLLSALSVQRGSRPKLRETEITNENILIKEALECLLR